MWRATKGESRLRCEWLLCEAHEMPFRRAFGLSLSLLVACSSSGGDPSSALDACSPRCSLSGDGGAEGGAQTGDASSGGPGWWRPKPQTSWQWQLSGALDSKVDVVMFDVDLVNTLDAELKALRDQQRIVICYFSAGTVENYRDDAKDFAAKDIGKVLPEWPDEKWVDIRSEGVRTIMQRRLDLAKARGCAGVEPDNVDGYDNDNGLGLTKADQLAYNRFLASEAHKRGLSVGLKNSLGLVKELASDFDWALNEECLSFSECALLAPFIAQDKAVFHVEYVDAFKDAPAKKAEVCGDATIKGFSTLIKTWDLGKERLACE